MGSNQRRLGGRGQTYSFQAAIVNPGMYLSIMYRLMKLQEMEMRVLR